MSCKLFIGGLSWNTDDSSLRARFEELNLDLFKKTLGPVQKVMKKIRIIVVVTMMVIAVISFPLHLFLVCIP